MTFLFVWYKQDLRYWVLRLGRVTQACNMPAPEKLIREGLVRGKVRPGLQSKTPSEKHKSIKIKCVLNQTFVLPVSTSDTSGQTLLIYFTTRSHDPFHTGDVQWTKQADLLSSGVFLRMETAEVVGRANGWLEYTVCGCWKKSGWKSGPWSFVYGNGVSL